MGLTNKQRVFIEEYLRTWNATQSAISAGYSPHAARAIGCKLLTQADIKEQITAEISERAMGADEVLQRIADIARGDITDLMDITTSGFNIQLLGDDKDKKPQSKLIKKIKQKVITRMGKTEDSEDTETIETEIELYSQIEALRLLAQKHGLLKNITEVTGKDGEKLLPDDRYDRAISSLSDAIRESVSGKGTE
jgi:phage terminase small subunit